MPGLLELLERRSTVRDYTDEAIPDATWHRIVRAGQQAPTDATGQLYCAIDVRKPGLREEVHRLIGDQPHVLKAARLLVICVDTRRLALLLEHRGESFGMRPHSILLFGLTDAALFAAHLATAAETFGYGTCFLGSVQNNSRAIARVLGLPQGVVPAYGLAIGRPQRQGPPKPRVPTRHVLHLDAYRDPSPKELDEVFAAMAAATRSGDWLNPIRKYFARGGIMDQREDEIHGLWTDQGIDPCGVPVPGAIPPPRV